MVPFRPMTLLRIQEPFNNPDWIFELKLDGFRALAHIEGHRCRLISRRGHQFKNWRYLEVELAHAVRCESAILDGEVVCLDDDGRSNFHKLLFRREWPFFFAFDLLALNGDDLRQLPLMERKIRLKRIMRRLESRVRYVDHIVGGGKKFFEPACAEDLEGIVAKWKFGTYRVDGAQTSWLKIKNPTDSQAENRHELFEKRRPKWDRTTWVRSELCLA
jgi:bifunctional non-homologous end joining protein LigD